MPIQSHSEPNTSMVRVNPHMPAPPIQPTCSLFSPKWSFKGAMMAEMATKRAAVTATAMRHAVKSLVGLMTCLYSCRGLPILIWIRCPVWLDLRMASMIAATR